MADYANAVVVFKVNEKYKNALESVFKKSKKNNSKYYDWYDYFNLIDYDGKLHRSFDGDFDLLNYISNIGYNVNMFEDEYSKQYEMGISGDIVTLFMNTKWCSLQDMERNICHDLDYLADEIISVEIVGYDKKDEYYYLNIYSGEIEYIEDLDLRNHKLKLESSKKLDYEE